MGWIILIGFGILIFLFLLMMYRIKGLIRSQIEQFRTEFFERFTNSQLDILSSVGERFEGTAKMLMSIENRLGELGEASRKIFDVGKNIADLGRIFQVSSIARGPVGEITLKNLLSELLSPSDYAFQYTLANGTRVDAIIRFGGKLIPIDAKFPMKGFSLILEAPTESARKEARSSFLSSLRKHVGEIKSKYILPEQTHDFALMYIPAESVYYEALRVDDKEDFLSYALREKVLPVSPATFYAFLVAIGYALQGERIQKDIGRIRDGISQLVVDLEHLKEPMRKLGKQLHDAQENYKDAEGFLQRFIEKVNTFIKTGL
jgi:DNA recombination protein RmuC